MKKKFRYLMSLMLMLALPVSGALAESVSLSGSLQPEACMAITAPFSGTVLTCPARPGMMMAADDALMTLDVTKIYAPCDGTVAAVRARAGDSLTDIATSYGAALYIEPASPFIIAATTEEAYNSNENRIIHVGETVYLTSVNNTSRIATGRVNAVDGQSYLVEVLDGNLRLNETCRVSREKDFEDETGRIGKGKTARNNPVAVNGAGSLIKMHVSEGDEVRRGDLLMEVAPGAAHAASAAVTAPEDGVLMTVLSGAGSMVQMGQAIATYFPAGTLQAVVTAMEDDLMYLEVGMEVTVELDVDAEEYHYDGVVESISYVAGANGGYEVLVSFENDGFVRQGMSVTVVSEDE